MAKGEQVLRWEDRYREGVVGALVDKVGLGMTFEGGAGETVPLGAWRSSGESKVGTGLISI